VVGYRLAILDEVFGDAYVGAEVGNADALTTATRRLFEDDSTAARLGEHSRAAVARYDLERIAQGERAAGQQHALTSESFLPRMAIPEVRCPSRTRLSQIPQQRAL
jgi:hypothetical protein